MALRVVQSLSLADQVFGQLGEEILSGRYAPGTQIPAERKLVATFGVNRHVVREAIKRLEQIGLVSVAQGGGTTVLDYRRTAGLDLLALMAEHATVDGDAMVYWLSVHEMRAVIAADAARLCAERATVEEKRGILALAEEMKRIGDGPQLYACDLRFWESVIAGAGNIAYRLAFNTLVKGVTAEAVAGLASQWAVHEVKTSDYRLPIATAITKGDGKAAEIATRRAMSAVLEALGERLAGRATLPGPAETPVRPPAVLRAVQPPRPVRGKSPDKKEKAPARAPRRS